MPSLPFARLNLRRNPFGEPPPAERGALCVGGLGNWPAFLCLDPSSTGLSPDDKRSGPEPGRLLQLLGPPGCGKSTLLLALQDRFPKSTLVAWCPVRGWPATPRSFSGPVFMDDAQMMGRGLLAEALQFPVLAVATQKDLAVSFLKAGFCVETVQVEGLVNLSRLRELVDTRLEWARRGPGPLPRVRGDVLLGLLLRHRPNLRAVQADLYDRYQQLEEGK